MNKISILDLFSVAFAYSSSSQAPSGNSNLLLRTWVCLYERFYNVEIGNRFDDRLKLIISAVRDSALIRYNYVEFNQKLHLARKKLDSQTEIGVESALALYEFSKAFEERSAK